MLILFAVDSEIPKTGRHVVRNVLLQDRAGARVRIAPIEELLLALIFLRHHPVDALLAIMFEIPTRQVSRTRYRAIDFLYQHLAPLLDMQTPSLLTAANNRCSPRGILGRTQCSFAFVPWVECGYNDCKENEACLVSSSRRDGIRPGRFRIQRA